MGKPLDLANTLEGILREHLDCHYTDFGVKANDNLLRYDWKSPINFALGHCYALSNHDSNVKEKIDGFLGDTLIGNHIEDLIQHHEYYTLDSEEDAYDRIEYIINELKRILEDRNA